MLSRYGRLFLWAAGWAVVAVAVALVALPVLPDPVAIHWGLDGVPDGSAPLWVLPVSAFLIALIGLALAPIFSVGREPSMEAFATVGMSGGLSLAIVLVTVSANYGIDDWRLAEEVGLLSITALFAIPVLALASGIVIGRHWYPLKVVTRSDARDEVIEVEPGERVSWVGRARVKGVPLGMFVVAIVLIVFVPDFPLWAFVLVIGLGLVFSQVEAQVSNDGLRIRLGGIPVRKVPLGSISSARAIEADPATYGGWGWRVVAGKTAIVLRSGPALAVTLEGGRELIMTVDDPHTGAGLLNGLIELSAAGP